MTRRHAVLVCPEPIRAQQQGVGIRFLEMARELSRTCRVSLWAPSVEADARPAERPFALEAFPPDAFARIANAVDVVVVHGHASEWYFDGLAARGLESPPLVVDLYDPFLVENLQYTPALGDSVYERDRRVLLRQLASGDFFLASSDAQRLFYVGLLMGMGRFDPSLYRADHTLRTLIDVAPFGVRPPGPGGPMSGGFKGAVQGIGGDDLLLFFGGVYDWYDPELLLDALEPLWPEWPTLRVVFSLNPNAQTTPQDALERSRARARAAGREGSHVFFLPWFPYAERFAWLGDADLAVSLHRPSLESELSLRTRVLDFLNAGLPVLATEGGEGARLLAESGGGRLVPAADVQALRHELSALLRDGERRRAMGLAGQAWVRRERLWERTLAPLVRFCAAPRRAPKPHALDASQAAGSRRSPWRRALARVRGRA